jgi:hypothetical protein
VIILSRKHQAMSNYSPFGAPVGKNQIAPGFQSPTLPGQGGSGFELKPSVAPAATPAQPAAGPLVSSGAGIVPQAQPAAAAPLQAIYENLPLAKKEQYEATYLAMFQAGIE